jgi:membrane protein implicated in regulation of membrane protease activity
MDTVSAFYMAHPFWIWLAIGAVFLVIEIATGSGWLLWPAGSAAIVALASLINGFAPLWQVVLFAVATIITTYLGRRFMKPRAADATLDINDQLVRLVGHRGEAKTAFTSGEGRVFVDGKEWSAELDGAGPLAHGDKIEVTAVLGGARLKVRAAV